MKAFSFPLLCSHQSRPRTHPLDYHRSSFLFCFSPRVPIQSIFISPSVPFTAAFISTRSLNLPQPLIYNPVFSPALWQALSHFLHLSVIFLPFLSTSRALFSLWLLPSQTFPSFIGIFSLFLSVFLSTHSLPLCQMHSLSPSILSKALYGPIKFSSLMSFPTRHTWADWTVQGVQGQTQTHTR